MAIIIRIMVIDDNKIVRDHIRGLLNVEPGMEVIYEAARVEDGIKKARAMIPDIVLIDVHMPEIEGVTATEIIANEIPQCLVIAMSVQGGKEHLRKAMFAGAKDYLIKPFERDELVNCIKQIYGREQKKREKFNHVVRQSGKVITIFSTKGGIGKTTIAINLAAALGMSEKTKVCVLDMDSGFGDAARFLNVVPNRSIADLIKVMDNIKKLDSNLLDGYITSCKNNVKLLAAPLYPEQADDMTPNHLAAVLKELQCSFDYVIIDTASFFNDILFKILDLSNQIIIVGSQDLSTLKNVKTCLEILKSLHYPKEKFQVVLSVTSPVQITDMKKSEELLKEHLLEYMPSDSQTAVTAENQGIPFVISSPDTLLAQIMFKLAHYVMEGGEQHSPVPTREKFIQNGVSKAQQPHKSCSNNNKVMNHYKNSHEESEIAFWTMP